MFLKKCSFIKLLTLLGHITETNQFPKQQDSLRDLWTSEVGQEWVIHLKSTQLHQNPEEIYLIHFMLQLNTLSLFATFAQF